MLPLVNQMGLQTSRHLSRPSLILYQSIRKHWQQDFKPGAYPMTPAEKKAAAEKYGLLPEEYVPYTDDGFVQHGDYPKLPDVSAESKDPFYPWDFPELKRNFGETMHLHSDIYGEDRIDVSTQLRYSLTTQFQAFAGTLGISFLLYYLLEYYKLFRPVLPKQFPTDCPQYTFVPAE